MKPLLSVTTPAAPRLRASVLGDRPVASSTCEPSSACSDPPFCTVTRSPPSLARSTDATFVLSSTSTPSSQNLADLLGDVGVLAWRELRGALDDRHAAAEAAEHLPELKPDVAASQDQEVLRQHGEFHDRRGVERGNGVEPLQRGASRAAARVDEDQRCCQRLSPGRAAYLDRLRADEPRLAYQQVQPSGGREATLTARTEALDDAALPLAHGRHVYDDRARPHTVVGGAAGEVRYPGARDHGLRRGAALVDAGAADVDALDQGAAPARPSQRPRQRPSGLAGSDHDGVVLRRRVHGVTHECTDSPKGSESRCACTGNRSPRKRLVGATAVTRGAAPMEVHAP